MKFIDVRSPNYEKSNRGSNKIKFIILHYTGMQSTIESLSNLISPTSKVSSHYLVSKKGCIYRLVKDKNIAWHAGKSKWKNYKNLNEFSIGIEIQNLGHEINYHKFTYPQISKVKKLCNLLKKKYKIPNKNILAHSDIAPLRKRDPGEKFPWSKFIETRVNKSNYNNFKGLSFKKLRNTFFNNLFHIGYRYFDLNKSRKNDRLIIKAFQQKFMKRPQGKIDEKTLKISHYLRLRDKDS